jgi:hypothetical protein
MIMKLKKFMFGLLGMAMVVASCTQSEPVDNTNNTNTPPEPTTEYVQLNLFSGCGLTTATNDTDMTRASWDDASGSGNMTLKWESVAFDSEKTGELALIISDGEVPIMSKTDESSDEEFTYSGMAVIPHEKDVHHADFQTVSYVEPGGLATAKVVMPDGTEHTCKLEWIQSGAYGEGYEYARLKIIELPAEISVEGAMVELDLGVFRLVEWNRIGTGMR